MFLPIGPQVDIYDLEVRREFAECEHPNISFDPSTYRGEETNVAVAYREDNNIACLPPLKVTQNLIITYITSAGAVGREFIRI